ncbi:YeeE/YedE thiosulfate transporter family protein [Picrophilus oshimae]|uniref:Membrane spanning protein n=1 Tax=Picrophilus torridus (strain ATCC 700027 / DSM 9790 / JCM 10055 / NBRC 100828 / KAW 2/3) TaxID=1122961 RepID=Q6L2D9_PICTO|nr:YeeE/YedE thiosulfate transporter family protein [Picrophilus oshimae]AAT42863.1 membrane spanning protein [Picrophilus oshimae DSM 9789]
MIGVTAYEWIGLFIGIIIGGLAEAWGISNPEVLIRLGRWKDRLFVGCIAIAIGAGAIALYGLSFAGVAFHWGIKPDYIVGVALGGAIFGTGIAISGYVPGTIWMALGEGRRDALYAVLGGLLGAASWTLIYQTSFGQWLVSYLNFGEIYFGGTVDTNLAAGFGIAIVWAIIMFTIAYTLPRYKNGKSCAYTSLHKNYRMSTEEEKEYAETAAMLLEGSSMPLGKNNLPEKVNYHWTVSSKLFGVVMMSVGIIIGLTVVLEMFLHQIFGESTTYSWIVAKIWLPAGYWKYSTLVVHTIGWEPFSDIGTLFGAFLASIFFTRRFQSFNNVIPPSWRKRFGNSQIKRAAGAFSGAFLMLLGARMADGCASGHILSGDLQMAVSSLEFFVVVMVFLLMVSHIIYRRVD